MVLKGNVDFETTKSIRKWLEKYGDRFPATDELWVAAKQLEDIKSQPNVDLLVRSCVRILTNSAKSKLVERKGGKTVQSFIRIKYLIIVCLAAAAIYGLILNGMVWVFTEKWLVPIPLGEKMIETVDYWVVYLVLVSSVSIVVSQYIASLELRLFRRIFVQIQGHVKEKETYVHFGGALRDDPGSYEKRIRVTKSTSPKLLTRASRSTSHFHLVKNSQTTKSLFAVKQQICSTKRRSYGDRLSQFELKAAIKPKHFETGIVVKMRQ